MSFRIGFILAWLSLAPSLTAAKFTLNRLTDGSRTYTNVTVIGVNATDLYFTHSTGISNVKLKYLDPSLQRRFHYDPKAAEEAEKAQLQDDSRFYQTLASNLANQALSSANVARLAAASSPNNLVDPISDKSHLGKPAPALEVEKWLSPEPVWKGKAVLISFWAPWSVPSRRYIPFLNGLQRKFAGRLVVIGLTANTDTEIAALEPPNLEFTSAIDTQGRLASAMGITSVPSVLLWDAKGILRYQGHPAALDENILENLLPNISE